MRRRAISLALLDRFEKLLRELDGFLEVLGDCLDFVRCILVPSAARAAPPVAPRTLPDFVDYIPIIMNTCVTAKTQVTMATARVASASRNVSSMVR